MTKLEQIVELLKDRELTSLEIASEINISKANCSSYLNTLYNDGRIERTSDKRPFTYRIAKTPKAQLKWLYEFLSSDKVTVKYVDESDIPELEAIKKVIE